MQQSRSARCSFYPNSEEPAEPSRLFPGALWMCMDVRVLHHLLDLAVVPLVHHMGFCLSCSSGASSGGGGNRERERGNPPLPCTAHAASSSVVGTVSGCPFSGWGPGLLTPAVRPPGRPGEWLFCQPRQQPCSHPRVLSSCAAPLGRPPLAWLVTATCAVSCFTSKLKPSLYNDVNTETATFPKTPEQRHPS